MDNDLGFSDMSFPDYWIWKGAWTCVHAEHYLTRYMYDYQNSSDSKSSVSKQGIAGTEIEKYKESENRTPEEEIAIAKKEWKEWEEGKNNYIVYIAELTDRYMSSRLKKEISERQDTKVEQIDKQKIRSSLIAIDLYPCEAELTGSVASASIKEGEETQVTLQTLCGGDPLEGQSLQILTTEELSTKNDVAFLETDDEGTAVLTVKGEKVGTGNVNVTTINKVKDSLITETDVAVEVESNTSEHWRLTHRVHCDYGDDTYYLKTGYSVVYDVHFKDNFGNGTVSVINHQNEFDFNGPEYSEPSNHFYQTEWTASPEFNDLQNIPISLYINDDEEISISGVGPSLSSDSVKKYAFFTPNLKSSWISNSPGYIPDSGEIKIEAEYRASSLESRYVYGLDNILYLNAKLKEGTYEESEDSYEEGFYVADDNLIRLKAPYVNRVTYDDHSGDYTFTATLTIERLDNK